MFAYWPQYCDTQTGLNTPERTRSVRRARERELRYAALGHEETPGRRRRQRAIADENQPPGPIPFALNPNRIRTRETGQDASVQRSEAHDDPFEARTYTVPGEADKRVAAQAERSNYPESGLLTPPVTQINRRSLAQRMRRERERQERLRAGGGNGKQSHFCCNFVTEIDTRTDARTNNSHAQEGNTDNASGQRPVGHNQTNQSQRSARTQRGQHERDRDSLRHHRDEESEDAAVRRQLQQNSKSEQVEIRHLQN